MTRKSKFAIGDVLYFKYPSRYTRSKDPKRIEVLIQIVDIAGPSWPNKFNKDDYFYGIKLIKIVQGKRGHWSSGEPTMYTPAGVGPEVVAVEAIEIETFSRRLTPAEKVLYG